MAKIIKVRLTEYYPFQTGLSERQAQMEGGIFDRLGRFLYSLEDYIEGKAPYVSLACDSNGGPPANAIEFRTYGTSVWIPHISNNITVYIDNASPLLQNIPFRLVDTGGHFRGAKKEVRVAGHEPIDICRRSKPTPDKSFSGTLTELFIYGVPEITPDLYRNMLLVVK